MRTVKERVMSSYAVSESGCWEWTKSFQGNLRNVGQIRVNGKTRKASRLSYEINVGAIPVGLCVLHRCDNPKCINPDHLFIGTHKDNVQDMIAKRRGLVGHKNGASVLTDDNVREIRNLAGYFSDRCIADKFDISPITVFDIRHKRTWGHLL